MKTVDGRSTTIVTKAIARTYTGLVRRVGTMDGFAAGGASGCIASATLCLVISCSGARDSGSWAALVWAAASIGALGAYILVRGLCTQAATNNAATRRPNERRRAEASGASPWVAAHTLTGVPACARNDVTHSIRRSATARLDRT